MTNADVDAVVLYTRVGRVSFDGIEDVMDLLTPLRLGPGLGLMIIRRS